MAYYLIIRTSKPATATCEDRAQVIKQELQNFAFVRKESFALFKVSSTTSCTITFFFETDPPRTKRQFNYPIVLEKHFEVGRDVQISAVIHERTYKKKQFWRSLIG